MLITYMNKLNPFVGNSRTSIPPPDYCDWVNQNWPAIIHSYNSDGLFEDVMYHGYIGDQYLEYSYTG